MDRIGSYGPDSFVFRGMVYKDIDGLDDRMLIDRAGGETLHKAIAAAVAAVEASPEAKISGF